MYWKAEYYQAYVVIVRRVISEKIPHFTIFFTFNDRLLRNRSKETAYLSNEGTHKKAL